jgi:shikimate dehydrogenase
MHRAALDAQGLSAWTYDAIDVEPAGLLGALAALRDPTWRGVNVTIPHKEAAAAALDQLAAEAAAIGAVNTVVVEGGRHLVGHNTDAPGFLDAAGEVRGLRCAVLGAGGSARAVVHALLQGGAAEVRVLARRARPWPGAAPILPWTAAGLDGCELVVGCVPPEAVPPPLDGLAPGARVIDLVYYRASALAEAGRRRGLAVQDGLEVLVRQGARAFELWTGRTAPLWVMRDAVRPSTEP